MTFQEYLTLKNFKKKSVRAHVYKMNRLGEFNETNVNNSITKLFDIGRTAATANKYLNTYRLYAKYLLYAKQATKQELRWLDKLKYYKEVHKQRIVFSSQELQKFLAYEDRYSMYFKILARTGARPMEIAKLEKSDVDFANNLIMIQESKTGEGRTVPLPDDLAQEFYDFLHDDDSYWCFPSKITQKGTLLLKACASRLIFAKNSYGLTPL